tara:strand:+ start:4230 stop:4508 length:279 start_codon:yes stop_codon:yes gene_type:complete
VEAEVVLLLMNKSTSKIGFLDLPFSPEVTGTWCCRFEPAALISVIAKLNNRGGNAIGYLRNCIRNLLRRLMEGPSEACKALLLVSLSRVLYL